MPRWWWLVVLPNRGEPAVEFNVLELLALPDAGAARPRGHPPNAFLERNPRTHADGLDKMARDVQPNEPAVGDETVVHAFDSKVQKSSLFGRVYLTMASLAGTS